MIIILKMTKSIQMPWLFGQDITLLITKIGKKKRDAFPIMTLVFNVSVNVLQHLTTKFINSKPLKGNSIISCQGSLLNFHKHKLQLIWF